MQSKESEMISDETMKHLCAKLVPINYLVSVDNMKYLVNQNVNIAVPFTEYCVRCPQAEGEED